jgi:beta-N-acetylhexosaminidase
MLGPLMIDLEGPTLTAEDRELLRHPFIGGVILFSRNYQNLEQLRALTDDIHSLRDPRLLIAVDQEGGRVQRFRKPFSELPALAVIGELFDRNRADAVAMATDCGWLMAVELRAVGMDFSFAPVLDLRTTYSSIIGDRAFHADPQIVARLARAYVVGMRDAKMSAVGKHFPGHGCVAADSHRELPVDDRDFYDIEQADLLPFRALVESGIEGIMTAHVLYPKVDNCAAGYSKTWIDQTLRRNMHFDGVVFSDDLNMAGADAEGGHVERARKAIAGGCDVLLICNHREAVAEVLDAMGSQIYPLIQARLMRMHARGSSPDMNELRRSAQWLAVADRVQACNPFPELDLGDDNLLG